MKKEWQAGDRIRAICEPCGGVVDAVFERRTLDLVEPLVAVPDVLVAACCTCGWSVVVPCSESAHLNRARRAHVGSR
jgi:hypothetical protein